MLLRAALEIVDRLVAALPSRVAYAVADLAGDAWHRLGSRRRRLVTANLARVCAATGRPGRGRALDALVRSAFRHHARYYVELLRAPHYPAERIGEMVEVPGWPEYEPVLRGGPTVMVSWHVGNFEPFGVYLAHHGIRALSPVEEIRPRALFEFLAARRGGRSVDLVLLRNARRPLTRRLREGGMVGIIGDRDLSGDGHPVTIFGHPTTFPLGPASLAVTQRAAIIVGRCLRVGPDRFLAEGEVIDAHAGKGGRAAITALAERLAARFELDVATAPEQWWGAFQPFWPDIRA